MKDNIEDLLKIEYEIAKFKKEIDALKQAHESIVNNGHEYFIAESQEKINDAEFQLNLRKQRFNHKLSSIEPYQKITAYQYHNGKEN